MTIYLLYVISPVVVWLIMNLFDTESIGGDDRARKKYIIICGIIMALVIGLRYRGTGSRDTNFYYQNWKMMSGVSFGDLYDTIQSIDLEYGYQIVVWMLSHFFPNGQWCLILSGAFFAVAVCMFTYRNSKNPVMALTVFYCLGLFSFMVQGLRQAIAMSVCLFAYEQCKQKHLFKFLLLVATACLFHASALVFAIVYIIKNFKLSAFQFWMFTIGSFIGVQLLPYIFSVLNTVMNENYDLNSASESGGVVAILIYVVIVLFGMIFKDESDKHYPLFMYSTIIAAALMLLRNSMSVMAERVSFYFAFGQMIVLSNSIASIKEQNTKLLINTIAVILCIGVALYKASYSVLIPYIFFWQR